MADGDITAVKILYRQPIGGGHATDGVAKSTKILVCGEITATYVSTGLAVNKLGGPSAFGVTNLDFIKFEPRKIGGVYPTAEKLFQADYQTVTQKIFLADDLGQANPAIPSNADAVLLRFVAVGDDGDAPELT